MKPVALAEEGDNSVPKECIVSGWGQTNRDNKFMSLALMEVNVTLVDEEHCGEEGVYCSEGEKGPGEVSIL